MRPSFRRLFCLSLLLFLFAACTQAEEELSAPTETSPALVSTATIPATSTHPTIPTRKPTLTASPTRTRMPSITPGPTMTPFPTRTATHEMTATPTPTFTPTFDVASVVTRTPAPEAQCPVGDPNLWPDFASFYSTEGYSLLQEQALLDFLNGGGTPEAVIAANLQRRPYINADQAIQQDLTGDGVAELIFSDADQVFIIGCQNERYVLLSKDTRYLDFIGRIHFLIPGDMNLDGVPELIIDDQGGHSYGMASVVIYEWNGQEFVALTNEYYPRTDICCTPYITIYFPLDITSMDLDGNGTLELLLTGKSELLEDSPRRKETHVYSWNGTLFVFNSIEYEPPKYRFEAVQDADKYSLAGDYDKALDLYQQAIFNEQLEWWSEERWYYEFHELGKGTPEPTPIPDTKEYYYLAAYARFRIMLIYILQGHASDAQTVFNTLQEKFHQGQPGYEFAEMAEQFWNEYQLSADIGLACQEAILYATDHPNILSYLGSLFHGYSKHQYEPPDACPFTSTP